MENLLNIFVRSIFIDNMIFAYFLGMCSGQLSVRQLCVETRCFTMVARG